MYEVGVVNASPLILLFKIGGLDWLAGLTVAPVRIPQAVMNEIGAGEHGDRMVAMLSSHPRFAVVNDLPIPPGLAAWDLGAGETQVLVHGGHTPGTLAILDDRMARSCAKVMKIRTIGTVGIVLVAKQRGWIPSARFVLETLIDQGMFLSPHVMEAALRNAGEHPPQLR